MGGPHDPFEDGGWKADPAARTADSTERVISPMQTRMFTVEQLAAKEMAITDDILARAEAAAHALLLSQPWWKRYANTVTGAVALLVNLIWLALATGLDFPQGVKWVFAVILAAGGVLGLSATPNGMTPNLLQLIIDALATVKAKPKD